MTNAPETQATTPTHAGDFRPSPMARLAATMGCTEGQLYTMAIGLAVAIALAVGCIPTSIRNHSVAARPSRVALTGAPLRNVAAAQAERAAR